MSCITTLCPTNPSLFAYNNTCIHVCPAGTFQHPTLRECTTFCNGSYNADNSTRRCVLVCPTNPNLFAYNN
jgi:Fe-S-cluster-containing hydrogenase component 2